MEDLLIILVVIKMFTPVWVSAIVWIIFTEHTALGSKIADKLLELLGVDPE